MKLIRTDVVRVMAMSHPQACQEDVDLPYLVVWVALMSSKALGDCR